MNDVQERMSSTLFLIKLALESNDLQLGLKTDEGLPILYDFKTGKFIRLNEEKLNQLNEGVVNKNNLTIRK